MEEFNKKTCSSKNNICVIDSNVTENTQKCDLIPFKLKVDKSIKIKKSQLLSLDGWENYQKEFIRLCFEFWEVNETQINDKIQSNLNTNDTEVEISLSLFADKKDNQENSTDIESKKTLETIISKEFLKEKCVEVDDNILKSKCENNVVIQQISNEINKNTDCKINKNDSITVKERNNKRTLKKKLKKCYFYKHMSKQVKSTKKIQSFTCNRSTSCSEEDFWKYKKWFDSIDKKKKHNLNTITSITSNNNKNNFIEVDFSEKNNNKCVYSPNFEAKRMEQKIRKLTESLKEQNKLATCVCINDQSTKFKSSNKFKHFFKYGFWGNQNNLDLHTLNDYIKYINKKMLRWQTQLNCLEDIRQRKLYKTKATYFSEEMTKYRFSECKNYSSEKLTDNYNNLMNSKYIEIENDFDEIGKQKKNVFLRFFNKTKNTGNTATATNHIRRNIINNIPVNNFCYPWISHKTDSKVLRNRIRKSISDSDIPAITLNYNYIGKSSGNNTIGNDQKTLTLKSFIANNEDHCSIKNRDDIARELCEGRHECFQAVMDRLEYVGNTFKEECRFEGLKTLCKVDVLAEFGHSAQAIDLFVSMLPLSKNPDLMIKKAEAAYDWKFFCHLSMWRYSYKD